MRCALLIILVAGCSRDVAGGKADGAQVFADACAVCHGPAGAPTEAMVAQLKVRDLTSAEFKGRANRELVITQVTRGSANKVMPSFAGALTDAQIAAVADYVLTLGPAK
ncbi:MAG: c-type cytochrome [Deltaproteobacteria bacterium]|nr:c-type cytochrome [Deltaproteobacteria bacterium]